MIFFSLPSSKVLMNVFFFHWEIQKKKKTMKLKMQFLIHYQSMDMSFNVDASCTFLLYQSEHMHDCFSPLMMYLEKHEKFNYNLN